ncbi:helix-hairpin-helix domain-containing protein [Fervidibacillus albus]|uniref:Helix-hairpin-helix domain-containing protein n=1 Tax=Fervidibacillus albus TaxID=2980026 RepID=A0A9E8LVM7_9BACI|nr:helix-hairpin-helix domain-containing protein [Fervidibacillus albus]WAA10356.1 helix-hairpin-helix domain-containing protein [Fervidibacillus albus]
MLEWETVKNWIAERKTPVIIGSIVVITILYVLYEKSFDTSGEISMGEVSVHTEEVTENPGSLAISDGENEMMMVDVKGAVKHPGVYEVDEGERIIDVIHKSGGFTDRADVNRINLSERVTDEMVIYVPEIGEELQTDIQGGSSQRDADRININDADESVLQSLPGIGPSKAEAIVQYREENGPFETEEELMNISGIGEKTFEKLKEFITVR